MAAASPFLIIDDPVISASAGRSRLLGSSARPQPLKLPAIFHVAAWLVAAAALLYVVAFVVREAREHSDRQAEKRAIRNFPAMP
jgi:hypothetical protein